MRDRHGIECPPGHKLTEARDSNGEIIAQFFEVDVQPKSEALDVPRSVAEAKADAVALAAALGVSEAEATRRALALAVGMLGGK